MKAFDLDWTYLNQSRKPIEIFRADVEELKVAIEDTNIEHAEISEFIKILGVPYRSTRQDIEEFFKGLKMAENGIILPLDFHYRRTGDCFVQFVSIEESKKALLLDGEPLVSR